MAYDATKPDGDESLKASHAPIRENFRVVKEVLIAEDHNDTNGKHEVIQLENESAPGAPGSAGVNVYSASDVLYQHAFSGSALLLVGVVSGTAMLFLQAAAPEGWTIDATHDDRVLMVGGGSLTGGDNAGSWTFSGMVEIPTHAHELNDHRHATNIGFEGTQLRVINDIVEYPKVSGTSSNNRAVGLGDNGTQTTDVFQTGESSGNTGTAPAVTPSNDGTWRPEYAVAIHCTKDS